ncbi:HotDog domain-containing protein, partial [Russula dissimulans]
TVWLPFSSLTRTPQQELQDAFRNPASPYHIPEGSKGPASPDERPATLSAAEEGRAYFEDRGFDSTSFWEQPIAWGDHDAFQHVNNVRYIRFFESSRIRWICSIGEELGGPVQADAFLRARGISFILKSIEVNFRKPVQYPDTLLIAHKPALESDPKRARTQFLLHARAFSYAQRTIVADSTSVITWYDYDKLAKCDPGDDYWAPVLARMKEAAAAQ